MSASTERRYPVRDDVREPATRLSRVTRRFINYPTNRLLAVVDSADGAAAAVDALVASGVRPGSIERLSGSEDADRLAGLGGARSLSRLLRAVQFMTMDQMPDFVLYERALRDGRTVLAVKSASPAERRAVAAVLRARGAHFMNFYGRFVTEEISLWRGPEPPIPGFLRR
jgi:hypothetical protein